MRSGGYCWLRFVSFILIPFPEPLAKELQVPTVAIESVYVWDNTSPIVDEVFSQRLGLIPLNIDPALVDMKDGTKTDATDMATDRNTIVFKLEVQCLPNPNASKTATDPSELYIHHEVRSGHLVWQPAGEQEEVFAARPPAPLNKDIVLAKLRPGMAVNMEVHAIKGVGKEHAKWSPVGVLGFLLAFIVVGLRRLFSDGVVSPPAAHQDYKTHSTLAGRKISEMFRTGGYSDRPTDKRGQR